MALSIPPQLLQQVLANKFGRPPFRPGGLYSRPPIRPSGVAPSARTISGLNQYTGAVTNPSANTYYGTGPNGEQVPLFMHQTPGQVTQDPFGNESTELVPEYYNLDEVLQAQPFGVHEITGQPLDAQGNIISNYWGQSSGSDPFSNFTNMMTGFVTGGAAGGGLGSEYVGSQITGNEADYDHALQTDIQGLGLGAGISNITAMGVDPTWYAGMDPTGGAAMPGLPDAMAQYPYGGMDPEAVSNFDQNVDPHNLDLSGLEGNPVPGYGDVTPGMTLDPSSPGFQAGGPPFSGYPVAPGAPGAPGQNGPPPPLGNRPGSGGPGGGGDWTDSNVFNATPFLLALYEANRQAQQINPILDRTNSLVGQVNPNAVRDAALSPYNRETASGLDRLTSSLSSRGVYGSSFGDASIADFKTARDVGAGELGTKSLMGAIGAQGALLDQMLRGRNASNTSRNLLLGAGLNASGRLFSRPSGGTPNDLFRPGSDPFGIGDFNAQPYVQDVFGTRRLMR